MGTITYHYTDKMFRMIQRRAYELSLRSGRSAEQNWHKAENEILYATINASCPELRRWIWKD
jgi:hypothetical protein